MNKAFLTFEYMDKVKGILIILIVAGHINGLTSIVAQNVLYSFHVSSFLFLPFLFNYDKLTIHNIIKIFKRYFIPYTIFFIVSYILYSIILHHSVNVSNTFLFWITGTAYTIKKAIGIGAYWFFPALITLLISIMIYNSLSNFWKKIFILFSLLSHLLIGYFTYQNKIFQLIPFNLYIPFYLFFLGFIIKNIIHTVSLNKTVFLPFLFLFFISLILSYIDGGLFNLASPYFPSIITRPIDFILRDALMISGFFSILYLAQFIPYIAPFGKYSIAIYTLHPLVIQLINRIYSSNLFVISIIKFFLVLMIVFILSHIIYKFQINKLLYPK